MTSPKLNFKISPQYDIDGYFLLKKSWNHKESFQKKFLSGFSGSYDFSDEKLTTKKERELVNNLTKTEFKIRRHALIQKTKEIQSAWEKIDERFFELSRQIFNTDSKSKQICIAYPSIWPSFLRNLKKGRTSFPYDRGTNHALFVISHEILHILF